MSDNMADSREVIVLSNKWQQTDIKVGGNKPPTI